MVFTCSYCNTTFQEFHHDLECRDTLLEAIYNNMLKLDKSRLRLLLNYIYKYLS
jgi:hypothetical protein